MQNIENTLTLLATYTNSNYYKVRQGILKYDKYYMNVR